MRFHGDAGKAKGMPRVDFRCRTRHYGAVHFPRRSALLLFTHVLLMAITAFMGGCASVHKEQLLLDHSPRQSTSTPPPPSPTAAVNKKGFFYQITHSLEGFHLLPRKANPPKAVPLTRVGTIRTRSQDGTYVIVELEPGVLVSPGTELLVTATGSEPAHLKVGDVQAPYFAADIVSGNPEPGDPVRQ